MAWLTSLLKKSEAIDESTTSTEDLVKERPSGPPLAVLSPDIGGVNSFRLRCFADTATAAADIGQLTPEMRRGTLAFCALHAEPVPPPHRLATDVQLISFQRLTTILGLKVHFIDMGPCHLMLCLTW